MAEEEKEEEERVEVAIKSLIDGLQKIISRRTRLKQKKTKMISGSTSGCFFAYRCDGSMKNELTKLYEMPEPTEQQKNGKSLFQKVHCRVPKENGSGTKRR